MSSALSDFVQSNKLRHTGNQSFAAQFWNNPGAAAQSIREKVYNGLSKSISTASGSAGEPLLNGDIEAGDGDGSESQGKSHSRKSSGSSGIFGFLGQDDAFGLVSTIFIHCFQTKFHDFIDENAAINGIFYVSFGRNILLLCGKKEFEKISFLVWNFEYKISS